MFSSLLSFGNSLQKPTRLLELSTRPYFYLLNQRYKKEIKTFRDIPEEEFQSWKEKGFEWVWFMGVWDVGTAGRTHDLNDKEAMENYRKILGDSFTEDDVIGSPYSIYEYKINPELGTEEDFKWLREKLHSMGMKLMVDFVPNHSAPDAPETTEHPNFYIRSPKGSAIDTTYYFSNGISYGSGIWCEPGWTDVAQYNYVDPEFRQFQINRLLYIASIADGCRCDMAHLEINDNFWDFWENSEHRKGCLSSWGYTEKPKTEFWADAISAVKAKYPDFKFMAESYEVGVGNILQRLFNCGFDWAYDKDPYDKLYAHDLVGYQNYIRSKDINFLSHAAHFTENHDEKRTMEEFWNWPPAAICAAGTLLTLPGLRFVNQDQWLGYRNKIDVHLRRAADDTEVPEIKEFYERLFKVLDLDALKTGTFTQLTVSGSDTIPAWRYVKGTQHVLIVANFNQNRSGGNVVLDDAPGSGQIPVKELIDDVTYYRDASTLRSTGLTVVLEQYQVQVFQY